jgi:hypothetical protein
MSTEQNTSTIPIYVRIIIAVSTLVIITLLAFIVYLLSHVSERQKKIEETVVNQKELADNILRSQSQYATKTDLESFIKNNGVNVDVIKNDLDKLQADIVAANFAYFSSLGSQRTNLPGLTGTRNPNPPPPSKCPDGTLCPDIDPYDHLLNERFNPVVENFGTFQVPIGRVFFRGWLEKPWSEDIRPRQYKVATILGMDDNQRVFTYNKAFIKVDGKEYEIPIREAITKQQYPEPKFSFWNPRLFLGVDGGVGVNPVQGEFAPSLSLGIMSYGRYRTTPDFSVLQIGAGYGVVSQTFQASITPFAYNVGQYIPFMNNMYLGPSIHVGTDGNVKFMVGLRVGL